MLQKLPSLFFNIDQRGFIIIISYTAFKRELNVSVTV